MAGQADFTTLLVRFVDAGVDFVLVGGVAAVVQGVPLTTLDVDLVHARTPENVARIVRLLPDLGARVRGHAPESRLVPGSEALSGPGHQLLVTEYGAIDLLGAIEDGLAYGDLLPDCTEMALRGRPIRVLGLTKLAELKRRGGRPKDRLAVALIEEVLRESGR
jgi:hypothetical protein